MKPGRDALAALAERLPDGPALVAQLSGPFARCLRLHPRRGEPRAWGRLDTVAWSPQARIHGAEIDPATRLDYHTGLAYPQDAASQLPVRLLDPQPGEVVIDACAAPGSKSSQIGIALGDAGLLVCCDPSPPRRRILAEVLARQGVVAGVVTPMPLEHLAARHPRCADAVLVDAPCSGHDARSERQVVRQARRQLGILAAAAALLRPGGRLVYSTCTPYPAENEELIGAFLERTAGWTVEAQAVAGVDPDLADLGGCRLWPQRQGSEPFFAIRLRAPETGLSGSLAGDRPSTVDHPWRAAIGPLPVWRRGGLWLVATEQAASCALPSEARGLILRQGQDALAPWGAQWLIERGAPAAVVDHATACALWAGEAAAQAPAASLLRTDAGAPLGESDRAGRLRLPSRMRRSGLR